jgi:putative SOS response-associated peptidase YedK
MCGRTVASDPDAILEFFDIQEAPEAFRVPHFNVAPTQPIGTIRALHRLELLRWGIPRPDRPLQINYRIESVAKSIGRQRRCIVTADGFYEWKSHPGTAKTPILFRDAAGHPLAFAGIWSTSTTADGEVVEYVAICTCPPVPPVSEVHDRMPLVIPKEHMARWLDFSADVSDLLSPTTSNLVAVPVSTWVNSAAHDDPRCIEPVPEGPAQRGLF